MSSFSLMPNLSSRFDDSSVETATIGGIATSGSGDAGPSVRLLLVDDEDDFRDTAADYFRRRGHHVTAVASGAAAIQAIQKEQFEVAVLDVHMPVLDGVSLVPRLLDEDDELQVLMLTGGATIDTAIASMKAGAIDYVTKPIRLSDLERLIRKAAITTHLQRENSRLKHLVKRQSAGPKIIGKSPQMEEIFDLVHRVAVTDMPVLIEGESGTGKELVARQIHSLSTLADRPIVTVNCAAVPEMLLESEFFGHEKGAFTGATVAKPGLFEIADGGTLFIDELAELAMPLQAKILRVLEDGVIRRVGSVKERRVKVRLVAATNRSLAAEVAEGRFREDLYYRVNVLRIELPPLRNRTGDLERLVKHLLGPGWKLDDEAARIIHAYSWPGNVRQLINALQRGKLLSDGGVIRASTLPPELTSTPVSRHGSSRTATHVADAVASSPAAEPVGVENLESLNRRFVQETMARAKGNKAEAARLLGIHRRSLYRLLERFSLE